MPGRCRPWWEEGKLRDGQLDPLECCANKRSLSVGALTFLAETEKKAHDFFSSLVVRALGMLLPLPSSLDWVAKTDFYSITMFHRRQNSLSNFSSNISKRASHLLRGVCVY